MKLYLYPVWLRTWHWMNAVVFLALIVSGVSMHYSAMKSLLMPFKTAIAVHNSAGIILAISYTIFFLGNIISGNYKQYLPKLRGMFSRLAKQTSFYLEGIFHGHPHPHTVTEERKFNPLQQLTYLAIMYALVPAILATGLFMMFPALAPEEVLGLGGIWPMATLHAALGFFLSVFMIGHVYLATTGTRVASNFKSMFTGWHLHEPHESNEPAS